MASISMSLRKHDARRPPGNGIVCRLEGDYVLVAVVEASWDARDRSSSCPNRLITEDGSRFTTMIEIGDSILCRHLPRSSASQNEDMIIRMDSKKPGDYGITSG